MTQFHKVQRAEFDDSFNGRIRKAVYEMRKEKGITLRDICKYGGVSFSALQKWEQHGKNIKIENIERIFVAVGLDLSIVSRAK